MTEHAVLGNAKFVKCLLARKAERKFLRHAKCGKCLTHEVDKVLTFACPALLNRPHRKTRSDVVVAIETRDLLSNILHEGHVSTPRWHGDAIGLEPLLLNDEAKRAECGRHPLTGDIRTDALPDGACAELEHGRHAVLRIDINDALRHRAGSHLHEQLRRTRHSTYGLRFIDAALEPARGLGVQPDAARRTADCRPVKGRRLKDDRGRPLRDLGLKTAHDPRKTCGLLAVGNDKFVPDGNALRVIERVQVLPCMCAACREAVPRHRIIVIGMERLPQFEHDEVRHVHHVVDGADARSMQTIDDPRRRRRDLHIAQDARREAPAKLLCLNADVHELGGTLPRRLLDLNRRKAQLLARQCRNFTRNADDTETVRTVRRQFELKYNVIESQSLSCRNAYGRIGIHDIDAVHLFLGQTLGINRKLARRTHHAV